MKTHKPKVTLIPSHPDEGYLSMNRYWGLACRYLIGREGLDVSSIIAPERATMTDGAGRVRKNISKYITYPALIQKANFGEVAHILDHSSAHLLKYIPSNVKKIVTVHDIIPLYDNDGLSAKQVKRFRSVLDNLHLADVLVSVSQYTKQDLIKYLGIQDHKIIVSQLGVEEGYFAQSSVSRNLPFDINPNQKIIFSVGGADSRKNLKLFPEIIKELKRLGHDIVFIRGGAKMQESDANDIKAMIGDNFREMGRVSEGELVSLYNNSDVVVVPSKYEGFGLPVLEAMAAGAPVVSSDQSSLPEVGLDSALYFSPDDALNAAHQIARIFDEPNLKEEMIARGKARVKELTWQRHFDEVKAIYLK